MGGNKKKELPKGFDYYGEEDIAKICLMRNNFLSVTRNTYGHLVEFPPVSFLEHFKRGAETTGEKVFNFFDKKGRELVLTPDAQVHTFNKYIRLNNPQKLEHTRLSWICPIFRYRNIPSRHCHHYGFTSINHNKSDSINELVRTLNQLISYVRSLSRKQVSVQIINPTLLRDVMDDITEREKVDVSENFRQCKNLGQQIEKLQKNMKPGTQNYRLITKLTTGGLNKLNQLSTYKQYHQVAMVKDFLEQLSEKTDVPIEVSLEKIHSPEILSGPGFIIKVDGKKVGDGGIYDRYGHAYDKKIRTVISVCSNSILLEKHIERQDLIL